MSTSKTGSPARRYHYAHPHPAVTVDTVVFGFNGQALQILLVRRANPPYAGHWAFPGGFVDMEESLEASACRELKEETGLTVQPQALHQLGAFGQPGRDPRERVISVVFIHLTGASAQAIEAGSDAAEAAWFDALHPPALAFDHAKILAAALAWLHDQARLGLTPLALLPPLFKVSQVQHLCELLAGRPLDKRNFRRHLLPTGLFVPTGKEDRSSQRRPARLYRLSHIQWKKLQREGFKLIR
ncbi:MAG: NUDIX hydrolase [Verrucomicrobiae bacterium]|nr:NUDIX hydrolase [Verrucomicrobiae bacterium]